MKICTACKKEKPLHDFYRHSKRKDGRQAKCKKCKYILFKSQRDEYRESNKIMLREKAKAYSKTPAGIQTAKKAREKRKSPKFYLNKRISEGIRQCLKGRKKSSWLEYVDYTVDDLKKHIERQFTKGMSWKNMGDWHIDHILPLASFDFGSGDSSEFKAAWALTNLRPLWKEKNQQKSDKKEFLL